MNIDLSEANAIIDQVEGEEDFAETYDADRAWRAPNGSLIDRSLQIIEGSTCAISAYDDGTWDYDGSGTKVNWDGGQAVVRAGETVFLDESDREWLECQVIKDPSAPLPDDIVSPWLDHGRLEKFLAEKLKEVEDVVLDGRKLDPNFRASLNRKIGLIADLYIRTLEK